MSDTPYTILKNRLDSMDMDNGLRDGSVDSILTGLDKMRSRLEALEERLSPAEEASEAAPRTYDVGWIKDDELYRQAGVAENPKSNPDILISYATTEKLAELRACDENNTVWIGLTPAELRKLIGCCQYILDQMEVE